MQRRTNQYFLINLFRLGYDIADAVKNGKKSKLSNTDKSESLSFSGIETYIFVALLYRLSRANRIPRQLLEGLGRSV